MHVVKKSRKEVCIAIALATIVVVSIAISSGEIFAMRRAVSSVPLSISSASVIVPIIAYHHVRPYQKGESIYEEAYDITPELLARELDYLRANSYKTITFDALADALEKGTPLPPKPIILSFDDGNKDQFEYALPILQEHGAAATFFIYTVVIGKPKYLSWDDIHALEKSGMEIGAHAKTHPYIVKIVDPKVMRDEIEGGKKILEDHLGHPVRTFAYPFGHSSPLGIEIVKEAGFRTARTLYTGNIQEKDNPLELRAYLATDNWDDFLSAISIAAI
ncbi:MAG: polysaccharide deacetylase [Candidatus Taylorbacteria bacterium]|nr:polysaccharide deacetylase [Candidatus Taylorbacteria bacterium]